MASDSQNYLARAATERARAAATSLPNAIAKHLAAATSWERLAKQAESGEKFRAKERTRLGYADDGTHAKLDRRRKLT